MRWAAIAVVPLVGLAPSFARAEEPYEGTWQASELSVRVQVESWGTDCGPRPPATSSEPGGTVRIEQSGDTLRLSGATTWQTDQCFTANQAAQRRSATGGEKRWRVVCATPEDDPKAERGTYTLKAQGPGRLRFREESRYDWQLKGSRCVATRVAERTFTREARAAAAPTADEERPSEEGPGDRCRPGDPARLALTPSERVLEPGERVCFYARVLDGTGCPVPDARVTVELERPPARGGTLRRGCFQAADSAAEAEGTFHVVARAGDLVSRAEVVVRAADLSDLIARGALAGDRKASGEGETQPRQEAGARVGARAERKDGNLGWTLAGAAVALLLLLGAVVLLVAGRRRRSTQPATAPGAMPVASAQPPGPPLSCPVCRQDYAPGTLYCPEDGAALDEAAADQPPRQARICPTCRRGFAPEARFCPHDSEELVPYAAFVEKQRTEEEGAAEAGRICPACGERYGPGMAFCGKDGHRLVLVN
ncbi:MAG: hypothetical protein ACODAU_12155 [Myxococcota bacterium]